MEGPSDGRRGDESPPVSELPSPPPVGDGAAEAPPAEDRRGAEHGPPLSARSSLPVGERRSVRTFRLDEALYAELSAHVRAIGARGRRTDRTELVHAALNFLVSAEPDDSYELVRRWRHRCADRKAVMLRFLRPLAL